MPRSRMALAQDVCAATRTPSARNTAGALGRRSWDDYDEMAEAIGDAKVRAFILGRPSRTWSLEAWAVGSSLLQRAVEGAALSAVGTIAPGRIGYYLTGSRSASKRCNGVELDASGVFRWGPGAELSLISRRPADWIAITATAESIRHAEAVLGVGRGDGFPFEARASQATPQHVSGFRRLLEEAMLVLDQAGPSGLHPESVRNLERTLSIEAARLFARSAPSAKRRRPVADRVRVLAAVEEFLAAAGGEPVYVSDLCERTGLSERTLRYVFEEQFGAGPIRVLRSRRLCEVRRALKGSAPGTRVRDVAGRFGFWHIGQFGSDYRKLFGERPSETLRRGRGRGSAAAERRVRTLAGWAEASGRLG